MNLLVRVGPRLALRGDVADVASGESVSFTLRASGALGTVIISLVSSTASTFDLVDNGDGTAIFSSAAADPAGSYEFTVEAVDDFDIPIQKTFTFSTVTTILPLMCTITSLPDAVENVAYSGSASGSGGVAPRTLTLDTAPAWMSIHPTTGVISGTPDAGDIGTGISVVVRVTDFESSFATSSDTLDVTAAPDPYFANVVSLLHANGSNGSTTFTDQIARTWTRYGTTTSISTAQSKFGGASLLVSAAGGASSTDGMYAAHEASFDMAGDFTIEWWQYWSGTADYQVPVHRGIGAGGLVVQSRLTFRAYQVYVNGSAVLTDPAVVGETTVTWHHYAVVRHSGVLYLYVNGVMRVSAANTTNINSNDPWVWGGYPGGAYAIVGYLDDMRVTKGVARYPSGTTFTPPTAEFPNS